MPEIIPVLHNINSPSRLEEFVSVCISLGYKTIIISKPTGSAAQVGIPEAFKLTVKTSAKLIIVPDLKDIKELFQGEFILFTSPENSNNKFNPEELKNIDKNIFLVFGGMEPGLTRRELELGKAVHIGIPSMMSTIGLASIVLYLLKLSIEKTPN
ncbi:MAG: RecB-family nuclease [Thermoprotei archaeon]